MIRTFAWTVVFHAVVAVAASTAQTVVVTRATAGLPIELSLNGTKIASGVADDSGVASLDVNLAAHGGKSQTDVHVSVEVCPAALRVQLVEAGLAAPAPSEDCTHTDITGTYVMKGVTTFVVDMSQPTPALWLTQGRPPASWIHPELAVAEGEGRTWAPLPKGVVVSGGGGLVMFRDAVSTACGDVSNCAGRSTRGALQGTATMWLTRNFALEASYLKPADVVASGNGSGYSFTTTLQSRIVAIAAKVGITAGPARFYGFGGEAYHWAVSNTAETVDATTVTVNGVNVAVNGGTYHSGLETRAWEWLAGGGAEFWVKQPVGIYVEGGYAPLKGAARNGGEGQIDDRIIYLVGGLTVHIPVGR